MIVNLSTVVPDKLVCRQGARRQELVDTGGTGLYCEVRATRPGQGTYYLRYKDAGGKTCHEKIGSTTDIDLDEARRRAKLLKAEITLGKDPHSETNCKKSIPTLTVFVEEQYIPFKKSSGKRGWMRSLCMPSSSPSRRSGTKATRRPRATTRSASCGTPWAWPENGKSLRPISWPE